MQPSIRKIAKEIGVSRTTVWKALNGLPRISNEVREKIITAVERLHYEPGHMKGGISLRKARFVKLIVFNYERLTRPFFADVIRGIESVARANNYSLQFLCMDEEIKREKKDGADIPNIEERLFEGLIIFGIDLDDKTVTILNEKNIPFVLINSLKSNENVSYIFPNYRKGAFIAIEHLVRLGHKRIGFITGSMELKLDFEKMLGYKSALAKFGLEYDEKIIKKGDYSEKKAYKATIALLESNWAPTAIFAADDIMAAGVIKAVRSKRLDVPDDIAVVGFNDMQIASLLDPPLTTVKVPTYKIGKLAMEILLKLMREKKKGKAVKGYKFILEPELIIRQSCGSGEIMKRGDKIEAGLNRGKEEKER
ncbi:LacI family DNA-binding transcriptional regulator [Candidatus Calescamantes bacterium]|nr:LacI family DNA-binding transcriptional regulator [Candidatus Calescamantes bacterium]